MLYAPTTLTSKKENHIKEYHKLKGKYEDILKSADT